MDYSYIDRNYNAILDELSACCDKMPQISVAIKSAEIDEVEYQPQQGPSFN